MVAETQTGSVRDFPAYLHFTPRPDQPDKFDEQTAFYESKTDGVSWLVGGNGSGTTTTLLAKVARFIYETPPPRRDTPFWVIAKSYDQVTKTCWKEKLYGQGHILDRDVDWDRVGWYKSKQRLPYSVPLKADRKGNNWMLEFRSYEQGIGAMMAQAIGGFAFVEQFPWGVFEEVLRGCREYNFPGSKLVEYTPVDPDLSIDIEEMLENGVEPEKPTPGLRYLPKNWEIYHANTQCAMEAGHVDKRWFEEFFGMVPKDMLDTRMKGLFCTFEGVIYKDFNTSVHCMGDEMWPRIKNCHHRRGIDWGAGPENDFACIWAARNGLGQWFCFDDKTDILTEHGWKRFKDWNGELVATANIQNEIPVLEFQTPTRYIEKHHDGDMVSASPSKGGVNFCVTPDHDMVIRSIYGNKKCQKVKANSIPMNANYRIPVCWDTRLLNDHGVKVENVPRIKPGCTREDFARFIGIFLAEGYAYNNSSAGLAVSQRTYIDQVRDIVSACFTGFCEHINSSSGLTEFRINSIELWNWALANGLTEKSKTKRVPRMMIEHWGTSLLGVFDSLIIGDGHNTPLQKERFFDTTSKYLADDMQELMSRIGESTIIRTNKVFSKYSNEEVTLYRVLHRKLRSRTGGAVPAKINISRTKYTGKVFCLTVPNGTLIVRRSGGSPFICGNCYDEIACHDQSKTTVDHLSDVYNQWEWPDDNSLYGPTYCDPSSPDNLRIAQKLSMYNTSVENLSMMRGKNSVIEGIEHIQYLLKPQVPVPVHDKHGEPVIDEATGMVKIRLEPKLFIHRQNCPKLVQQMKTYRWLRGSNKNSRIAVNPKDAPRQPLKKADHQVDAARYVCFSDDFMTGSTISSAKNHSALTTQLHGEYIPRQGLRGFTTQHRDRG